MPRTYASRQFAAVSTTPTSPVVEIMPDAYVRLQAYVDLAPGEVSGFGLVDVVGEHLVVRDVFLPPQQCTGASTDVSANDLAGFLRDLLLAGHDMARVRLWWHSHVDFEAYFSATDRATMANAFPQADWMVGLVLNRRGDVAATLRSNRPVPLRLDDLPVRLHVPAEVRQAAGAAVEAVVRSTPALPCYAPGGWVAGPGGDGWEGAR